MLIFIYPISLHQLRASSDFLRPKGSDFLRHVLFPTLLCIGCIATCISTVALRQRLS